MRETWPPDYVKDARGRTRAERQLQTVTLSSIRPRPARPHLRAVRTRALTFCRRLSGVTASHRRRRRLGPPPSARRGALVRAMPHRKRGLNVLSACARKAESGAPGLWPPAPAPTPPGAACGPHVPGKTATGQNRCLARHRWRAAIHTPGRPTAHGRCRVRCRLPAPARAAVRPPGRRGRADAPARPCGAKVCAACAAQKKGKAKPCGRVAALPFFWRVCRAIFPAKVPGAEKRPCMVVAVFRPRGPPPPPGTNRDGGVVAPRPCVGTTPSRAGGFAVCGPLRAAAATISNGPHQASRALGAAG